MTTIKTKYSFAWIIYVLVACISDAHSNDISDNPELKEAFGLYQRAKMEDLKLTTDPNELGEPLTFTMLAALASQQRFEDIFNIGDEAFEKESDERFGKGLGATLADGSAPTRLQTNIGGFDSGSCRSCHFKGGPDGSGTLSSIALLRSDGMNLDTATLRDSPHVMGLGYIQLIAQEMTQKLQSTALFAREQATQTGKDFSLKLVAKGIEFGEIIAKGNGLFDTSKVKHVRADLVVRPFGHKGRARDLFEFVDEALQMHHGLQTDARLEMHKSNAGMIGVGPDWDPDQDDYSHEAAAGRSLMLAAYLSMLPVPSIIPPKSSSLALAWGDGQRLLSEVGCTSCHVRELRFNNDVITHKLARFPEVQVTIPLFEAGIEPTPVRLDNGPDSDDIVIGGTPIYPFTDLRLHDLGPDLADKVDEPTIDGKDTISKSVWLTRSLWGLADTAPYLHDGRASTVQEAILLHGGDAAKIRDRFIALGEREQKSILVYLASLTREPTALIE